MEFTTYALKDVCKRLVQGDPIEEEEIENEGPYPVLNARGISGYCKRKNFEGKCCLINGRPMPSDNAVLYEGAAYVTEHLFIAETNELADPLYLTQQLSKMDFKAIATGKILPRVRLEALETLEVSLPPMEDQIRLAKEEAERIAAEKAAKSEEKEA